MSRPRQARVAELRAQVAQFFLVEGGLISRIESFDCYDPLGEPFA